LWSLASPSALPLPSPSQFHHTLPSGQHCQMHWRCAFYHASHGARSSSPGRGAISGAVCFSVAVTTIVVAIGIAIIIVESAPPYAAIWVALPDALSVRLPPRLPRRLQRRHLPQRHRHQLRLLFRCRCHHRCGHWHRHRCCHCHRRVSFTVRCHLGGGALSDTLSVRLSSCLPRRLRQRHCPTITIGCTIRCPVR
jgi:hypothetical protein